MIDDYLPGMEFFRALDKLPSRGRRSAKVVAYTYDSRYSLQQLMDEWTPRQYDILDLRILEEDDDKTLLSVKIRRKDGSVVGRPLLLVFKLVPLAFLVTTEDSEVVRSELIYYNKYYPFLNRIFLRDRHVYEVLRDVEKQHRVDVVAKDYVVKRYYGQPKTEVCYERTSFKEAFLKAHDRRLWIDSISFILEQDSFELGRARIARNGMFHYHRMTFSRFYFLVLTSILSKFEIIHDQILNLRPRSLSYPEPSMIRLILTEDVFASKGAGEKLVGIVHEELPRWGYSVLSTNQNLVEMLVHDYSTGSSYDISVPTHSEIRVFPQTQVTNVSLAKILSVLIDNFEGDMQVEHSA
jgi:hypothetical protein